MIRIYFLLFGILFFVHAVIDGILRDQLLRLAQEKANLYVEVISNEVAALKDISFVLTQDGGELARAFQSDEGFDSLDEYLSRIQLRLGLQAIALLDTRGVLIAKPNSSDWLNHFNDLPAVKDPTVGADGHDNSFAPYSNEPRFSVTQPIFDFDGEVIGRLAIQVSLRDVEALWRTTEDMVAVTDQKGRVLLSQDTEMPSEYLSNRSFETVPASSGHSRFFSWITTAVFFFDYERRIKPYIFGDSYLSAQQSIEVLDCNLHVFIDRRSLLYSLLGPLSLTIAFIILLVLHRLLNERLSAVAKIEGGICDNAALLQMNLTLRDEIEERRLADKRLYAATSASQRSYKLAALGQLAASVNHELGQPITAIKNYLAVADRIGTDAASAIALRKVGQIVLRMQYIFEQLKFFTRPIPEAFSLVAINEALASAANRFNTNIASGNVGVLVVVPKEGAVIKVVGNRLRLEQLFMNLFRAVIDATEETEKDSNRRVLASLSTQGGMAVIKVTDSDQFLGSRSCEDIVEVFDSPREIGCRVSLGLAISAEIIYDHEGVMMTGSAGEDAIYFEVRLPLD